MQDSSNSPPSAGDTSVSVFSPTRPPDQQGMSRHSRNKRRKERSPKSEQENVKEDEAINKSNSNIQDSGSVPDTLREANVSTVTSVGGINSPPSSVEDDYVPTGNLFDTWKITGTPQEDIEFSRDEPNTPTLNNGTVPEDSTTPEEPCFTTMEPLVPVLSEIVYRYKELTRGSRFQGRIQNTKNQILNTASQWASNFKERGKALDRNTSTTMFPDPNEAEDIGGNPSPYEEEPSPAILILQLLDQALREVGMAYPLFMNAKIAVSEISATFHQFRMSTYEGVIRHSQNAHRMHMFFKRLWGDM
jgi:hypothetical protein